MNELAEPIETIRQAPKRAPVIWQIASITDEHQSVTVVFPTTPSESKKEDLAKE